MIRNQNIWNEDQRAAILQKGGPCLVLAGPGSGKTAVIIQRAVCLIRNGVPAEQILVLTFTRAAAAEMRERFAALESGDDLSGAAFSTFHSLCFAVLKEEGLCGAEAPAGDAEKRKIAEGVADREMPGLSAGERKRMVRLLLEQDRRNMTEDRAERAVNEDNADHTGHAGNEGNAGRRNDRSEERDVKRMAALFRGAMRASGMIDYPDMIHRCLELFSDDPRVLHKWQDRFRFIMIDEAQDMSRAQLRIAALLAGVRAELFVVGDDDQSIYGFRGVSPANMAELARPSGMLPSGAAMKTEIIHLSMNYRSVPEITSLAGRLIRHNRERFRKHIRAHRSGGGPEPVRYQVYADERAEAAAIADEICRAEERTGAGLSEIAVLCRTGGQLRAFLRAFSERGIPYHCKEDPFRGIDGQVRADMDAFYALAEALRRGRPWECGELRRALSVLDNGLYAAGTAETFADPRVWAWTFRDDPALFAGAQRFLCDLRVMGRLEREAFAVYLLRAVGYERHLAKLAERAGMSAAAAERAAAAWCSGTGADESGSDEAGGPGVDENQGVRVMTMHASKGLEFRTVYLPSLNEGVIPHSSAKSSASVEEERRLMYVAVTRAKDELRLSCVRKLHAHHPAPSRFLKEMLGARAEL